MVLLGRMLVMTVACMAMVLAHPVARLADPEKDTVELAQQVLETFGDDAQHELSALLVTASARGKVSAQDALGAAYHDGHMVKSDIVRAKAWFFMACRKTGDIYAGQKPKAVAKPAMGGTEALSAELRARRMESYKIDDPEGGK
jgi:hypothetical protein